MAGSGLRRAFFAALAALVAAGLAGAAAFLWPNRRAVREYDAGAADAFAVGDVRHVQVGAGGLSPQPAAGTRVGTGAGTEGLRDFHLVRRADGFVAFWHSCTHVGCAVPFRPDFEFPVEGRADRIEKGLFRCPCHGSTFSRDEGQTVFGPASRPLDALPVRIERGRVLVTIREGAERRRVNDEPAPIARWPG